MRREYVVVAHSIAARATPRTFSGYFVRGYYNIHVGVTFYIFS